MLCSLARALGGLSTHEDVTEREYRGPKKELKFVPGEFEDVRFIVTGNRAVRVLVWLVKPILRTALAVRRLARRLFSISNQPPNVR